MVFSIHSSIYSTVQLFHLCQRDRVYIVKYSRVQWSTVQCNSFIYVNKPKGSKGYRWTNPVHAKKEHRNTNRFQESMKMLFWIAKNLLMDLFLRGESKYRVQNDLRSRFRYATGPWRPWMSIIKSNFENQNFSILISYVDYLQKTIIAKCSSFFHIPIRT